MFHDIQRKASVYAAMASVIPKIYLAYSLWFWVSLVLNVIATTIFVFFWRAVYANTDSIAGLDLQQTLNYILLAQIFAPLGNMMLIFEFGYGLREGGIAHALLRPVDFQGSYYGQYLTSMVTELVLQVPLALVVTLVFKVQWPTDPRVWAAFTVSAFLGTYCALFLRLDLSMPDLLYHRGLGPGSVCRWDQHVFQRQAYPFEHATGVTAGYRRDDPFRPGLLHTRLNIERRHTPIPGAAPVAAAGDLAGVFVGAFPAHF